VSDAIGQPAATRWSGIEISSLYAPMARLALECHGSKHSRSVVVLSRIVPVQKLRGMGESVTVKKINDLEPPRGDCDARNIPITGKLVGSVFYRMT
jgi:hypothetical protein